MIRNADYVVIALPQTANPLVMLRLVAAFCCLALSFSPAYAQSSDESRDRDLTPRPLEVSAEVNFLRLYGGDATVGSVTGRGFTVRIGYRPTASRRTLLEAYGMHAPEDRDPYNRAPQIDALGLAGSYLLRDASKRVNPYLTLGGGLYRVDAQKEPPCRIEEGCFDEGGPSFRDATLTSAVAGAGLYVTVIPLVALRADARIYAPLGASDGARDSGEVRPSFSIGVSIRP